MSSSLQAMLILACVFCALLQSLEFHHCPLAFPLQLWYQIDMQNSLQLHSSPWLGAHSSTWLGSCSLKSALPRLSGWQGTLSGLHLAS